MCAGSDTSKEKSTNINGNFVNKLIKTKKKHALVPSLLLEPTR